MFPYLFPKNSAGGVRENEPCKSQSIAMSTKMHALVSGGGDVGGRDRKKPILASRIVNGQPGTVVYTSDQYCSAHPASNYGVDRDTLHNSDMFNRCTDDADDRTIMDLHQPSARTVPQYSSRTGQKMNDNHRADSRLLQQDHGQASHMAEEATENVPISASRFGSAIHHIVNAFKGM